jgi:hypothetical protein
MKKEIITKCPKCGRDCRELPTDNKGLCLLCALHATELLYPFLGLASSTERKIVTFSDVRDLMLIMMALGFGIKGYSLDDLAKLWRSLPGVNES